MCVADVLVASVRVLNSFPMLGALGITTTSIALIYTLFCCNILSIPKS